MNSGSLKLVVALSMVSLFAGAKAIGAEQKPQLRPSLPASGVEAANETVKELKPDSYDNSTSSGMAKDDPSDQVIDTAPPSDIVQPLPADVVGPGQALFSKGNVPPPTMEEILSQVKITAERAPVTQGKYLGVVVTVHNATKAFLVFDGDNVQLHHGQQVLKAISDAQLEGSICPIEPKSAQAKEAIAAAVSLGTAPAIRDSKINKRPVRARYGCDEVRRQSTFERMGKRVVWPNDTTTGVVFLDNCADLSGSTLEVPVVTWPAFEVRGSLSVPL